MAWGGLRPSFRKRQQDQLGDLEWSDKMRDFDDLITQLIDTFTRGTIGRKAVALDHSVRPWQKAVVLGRSVRLWQKAVAVVRRGSP